MRCVCKRGLCADCHMSCSVVCSKFRLRQSLHVARYETGLWDPGAKVACFQECHGALQRRRVRFHFEMRRRLAAMDAAINQDCDRAPTSTAANRQKRRMAWVGHLPASFTFERAQVETTLQQRLWRILCGSGMKPGLLAILATQRAQRVKREEHQVGMSVHELLLGMPLSAMWLPGRAFGLAPEKAWTKHRDGELPRRGIKEEFSKLTGRPLSWPTRTTWTARRSRFSASTARGRPMCWPPPRRPGVPDSPL